MNILRRLRSLIRFSSPEEETVTIGDEFQRLRHGRRVARSQRKVCSSDDTQTPTMQPKLGEAIPTERNHDQASAMASVQKQCALCGATIEHGLISCPKCGRGLFESTQSASDLEPVLKTPHASKGKGSSLLTLKCRRCNTVYNVGEDAGIMPMEHVFDKIVSEASSVTIIGDGTGRMASGETPRGLDLVVTIGVEDETEMEHAKKVARDNLDFVLGDLKQGNLRVWWCMKCQNHDSPYEYPQVLKSKRVLCASRPADP